MSVFLALQDVIWISFTGGWLLLVMEIIETAQVQQLLSLRVGLGKGVLAPQHWLQKGPTRCGGTGTAGVWKRASLSVGLRHTRGWTQ